MKTNLKTVGTPLTDALSDYVDEKAKQIEKLLDPKDSSAKCDIEIGMSTKHHHSGNIFRAEINLHIAGHDFRAESEKEDLYIAINDAKEEIMQAVASKKTKDRTSFRKGASKVKNMLKGIKD